MKKVLSIALILVVAFTLTISAAAEYISPVPKEYYDINIGVEPNTNYGTAIASSDKVQRDSDDTVTLTASDKNGFFNDWVIEGDFEIVEGDLNSPVIKIRPKSDIKATANFSKEKDNWTFTVEANGKGTASVKPSKLPKGSDELVTFTATDGEGKFIKWELQFQYDIVEGSLTSKKLVVRPHSDINAIAYFTGAATPDSPTTKPNGGNGSNNSPKTGDPLFLIIALVAAAFGTGVFAFRKIKGC